MSEGRKPMYALVINGEWDALDEKQDMIVEAARNWVSQKISDFYRHGLPMQVTPEIARDLDVYVYKLTDENRVELPFQRWFDEYYAEEKQDEAEREEREWKRYLELAEKFRDRIAKWDGAT